MKITSEYCPRGNRRERYFREINIGDFFTFDDYLFVKATLIGAIAIGLAIEGKPKFEPQKHSDFELDVIVNPVEVEIEVFYE